MAAPSADSINEILHATVGEMLAVAEEIEATVNSNNFFNHIEGFAEIMSRYRTQTKMCSRSSDTFPLKPSLLVTNSNHL